MIAGDRVDGAVGDPGQERLAIVLVAQRRRQPRVRIVVGAGVLGEQKVQPGMQTDMFIITGERTFLGYLFQPLADSFNRAWRER